MVKTLAVGDVVPQILINNSHDRSLSLNISGGAHVYVCANGMTVSEGEIAKVRCKHIGVDIDEVLNGAQFIGDQLPQVMNTIEEAKNKQIEVDAKVRIIEAGAFAKWGDEDNIPEALGLENSTE